MIRKITVLAAEVRSYQRATIVLRESDVLVSAQTVQRVVHEVGHELVERRDSKKPQLRLAKRPENVPALAVVECDGGRIRTREPGHGPGVTLTGSGWSESKHACLIRATHQTFTSDPQPDPPECFLDPKHVAKIVESAALSRATPVAAPEETLGESAVDVAADIDTVEPVIVDTESPASVVSTEALTPAETSIEGPPDAPHSPLEQALDTADWRPKRLVRTVISSLCPAKVFGGQMKREAHDRQFFQALARAFLGDGLPWNWSIWKKHFPTFIPILDFIHALSYLFTAAKAVHPDSPDDAWDQYQVWMTGCWRGEVAQILAELTAWQERLGTAPKGTPDTDPRVIVRTTLRYLTNNQPRMKYAEYRRAGLPVTTAWMESLVKEMNYRVKGTEMFWNNPAGAEAILQIRSAALSEDNRLIHHLSTRPGSPFVRKSGGKQKINS